jgi:hypothetical protein
MSNIQEQAAKAERVPVFFNNELVMLDRWTLTQLEARAYRAGVTVEEVIMDAVATGLTDPATVARMGESAKAAH